MTDKNRSPATSSRLVNARARGQNQYRCYNVLMLDKSLMLYDHRSITLETTRVTNIQIRPRLAARSFSACIALQQLLGSTALVDVITVAALQRRYPGRLTSGTQPVIRERAVVEPGFRCLHALCCAEEAA